MAENWKPGDVAIRTCTGDSGYEMRSMVVKCPDANHYGGLHWHHENGGWDPIEGGKVTYRRLLVIDPEDRETVERLLDSYANAPGNARSALQTALRAMLQSPKQPKPDEPLGLGAVVRYDGSEWVGMGYHQWFERPTAPVVARQWRWSEFSDAVEVLSEGWTA